jgi:homeobox protein cut-like
MFINFKRLLEQYIAAQHDQNKRENKNTVSQTIQNSIDLITTSTLEVELSAKEKEISQLVDDIQKLQMKSIKIKQMHESEKQSLEDKLSQKEQLLRQLEAQLKSNEDYEEIKRELIILKSIEFNSNDLLNDQKPLEVLLLEKNRQLQSENTQLKVQGTDYKGRYEEEKQRNLNLSKTIGEQKQLISDLERDLLNVARNDSTKQTSSVLVLNSAVENNSLDYLGAASEAPSSGSEMIVDSQDSSLSLLNIVSSQRERFRLRVQELEMETISYKQQLNIIQGDMERLKQDNVKLYEKIKFLQSYEMNKKSGRSKYSTSNADEEIVLNRYTNEYEKRLDPFTKFRSNERQKTYTNLKLHDKFTLSLGRFILSSKTGRLVFVLYIAIIHLLIFLSSYKIAHTESEMNHMSAECAKMYGDHMANVHGDKDFHI